MPAPKDYDPNSRRSQVYDWFTANRGYHRPVNVAAALGMPTHPVATASKALYLTHRIDRTHTPQGKNGTLFAVYGVCPVCGAGGEEHCRTPNGRRTPRHASRAPQPEGTTVDA